MYSGSEPGRPGVPNTSVVEYCAIYVVVVLAASGT